MSRFADFIAPRERAAEHRGLAVDRRHRRGSHGRAIAKRANDDYSAILGQGAGRSSCRKRSQVLAPACAQGILGLRAEENARQERDSSPKNTAGIRPAPGYPAQPDDTEKRRCSRCSTASGRPACGSTEKLRDVAGRLGVRFLFQSPESHYFGVGKIEPIRSRITPNAKAGHLPKRELAGADPELQSLAAVRRAAE